MGYKITMVNGIPQQAWEQDNTIGTDVLVSCLVARGSFFANTIFGLPELPRKIDDQAVDLIRQRFLQATKWLLDVKRAKSIDVLAERDNDDRTRVNVAVTAVQANGQEVTFETFVEVV